MKHRSLLCAALLMAASSGIRASEAEKSDSTAVHALPRVEVKALRTGIQRDNIPGMVQVVSAEDISRSTATSLAEIIKNFTPAESVDLQGLTGGIEMRGFTPNAMGSATYTALLLDGLPLGTRNPAATFPSGISSVEILPGPFSSVYGSGAMGGIVNVISTDWRGRVRGNISTGGGSYATGFFSGSAGGSISRRVDFNLNLDFYNRGHDYRTGSHNIMGVTDYEKTVFDPHSYDTVYHHTSYDKTHASLRLGWDVSDRWRLNLYNDIYYTGNAGANGGLWGIDGQTDKKVMRDYHRLDVTGRAGRHLLRFSPYLSFESSDYRNITWGNTSAGNDYNTYGALAQDAMSLGFGTLVVGADNFTQRYSSTQALEDGTPFSPYQPNYMNSQTGVFSQLSFSIGKSQLLHGIAGLRYDNIIFRTFRTPEQTTEPASRSYNTVNPNFALECKIPEGISLHTSVGRAFLAPDAYKTAGGYTDSYGTTYRGNPDLKPEVSVTWETGVRYSPADIPLEAAASIFMTDHNNMIIQQYSIAGGYYTYSNALKANVRGFDINATYDLGANLKKSWSMRFMGAYTHIFHSEVGTATVTSEKKYLARTKFTFGAMFSWKWLDASLMGRYVGSRLEDNFICSYDLSYNRVPYVTPAGLAVRPSLSGDSTIRNPDYLTFDLSVTARVCKSLNITGKIANLFDELYMERDGYYMPGRNFTVAIGYSF